MKESPFIAEFTEGQTVTTFLYVRTRQEKTTKAGEPYLDLTLLDATGSVSAKVWANVLKDMDKAALDGAVKVQGFVEKYQDRMQLNIKKIRPVQEEDRESGFKEERLFKSTEFPREEMFSRLLAFLERVEDAPLKEMMSVVLRDFKDHLLFHPASRSLHHAFVGGLLEHTLSVVHTSVYFAEKYGLDLDIMICGAMLHDLAKVWEISNDPKRDYTVRGRLLGHVVMGRDLLRGYASKVEGLKPETLVHLEHIILSHQGEREWSAPVVPQTPEAMAVHLADNSDAKMEMFRKTVLEGDGEEDFQYHKILERYIFKKGTAELKGKYPFF
ncbi:MAG: HD domain-containing protein [Nitrospinae bacterium]|nr:HD domain-containing protein [Nitrospinota bacterium]